MNLKHYFKTAFQGFFLGAVVSLFLILAVTFSLNSCEPKPVPMGKQVTVEPVQTAEKIWTEDDFKQAEIDPLDVAYNVIEPHLPPPDNVVEEDAELIKTHTQKQLQRLTAGGTR
ncbi:hypothetical protein A4G19_15755 [Pasteurellaceae bacterium Macca]|nr:hypothetical protein [Pasteurellaceae bacterium Macca]MCK3656180.1 hypothetical protein [Pasteurellaceae bacterium Macca]MCK3657112.1 hypothetical protein [Pasteurellaceae bacterium Macca]